MKKNLRRICFVLLMMLAICKCVYAKGDETGTVSLFSGYMKFIFAGVALVLLVLVLSLSYKLDTEEPVNHNEGKVSKKKLGSSNKNRAKEMKKAKNNSANPVEEDFSEDYFENNLSQSDFDSEEVAGFKDDNSAEKIVEPIEDYDEELEKFNRAQEAKIMNDLEDDSEYEDLSGLTSNLENDIDDLDDDAAYYNKNTVEKEEFSDMINFDDSVFEEIEDYEDTTEEDDDGIITDAVMNGKNNEEDVVFFDTSIIDDLDDYEDKSKKITSLSKNLSSSSMPKKSSRNRFAESSDTSSIGFRNKASKESSDTIGFRNKKVSNTQESTIGFRRKIANSDSEKTTTRRPSAQKSSTGARKTVAKKTETTSRKKTSGTTAKKKKI